MYVTIYTDLIKLLPRSSLNTSCKSWPFPLSWIKSNGSNKALGTNKSSYPFFIFSVAYTALTLSLKYFICIFDILAPFEVIHCVSVLIFLVSWTFSCFCYCYLLTFDFYFFIILSSIDVMFVLFSNNCFWQNFKESLKEIDLYLCFHFNYSIDVWAGVPETLGINVDVVITFF